MFSEYYKRFIFILYSEEVYYNVLWERFKKFIKKGEYSCERKIIKNVLLLIH